MKTLKKIGSRAAIIGAVVFSLTAANSFAGSTYSEVMNYLRARGYVVYSLKPYGNGNWIADTQYSCDTVVLTGSSGIVGAQTVCTSPTTSPIVVVEDWI